MVILNGTNYVSGASQYYDASGKLVRNGRVNVYLEDSLQGSFSLDSSGYGTANISAGNTYKFEIYSSENHLVSVLFPVMLGDFGGGGGGGDVATEKAERIAADNALQSQIDGKADKGSFDDELNALRNKDAELQNSINGSKYQLDAETARATAAESALDTRLTTAEGDIDSLESSVDALYNTEVQGTDGETSVSSSTSGKVKTFVVGLASAIKTKVEAAYSHISDVVKHITSTERTNWNTAYTHSQTEGNPHGTEIEEIDGLRTELTTIESDVAAIESVIPSEATTTNKLADKAFVNSSITTNTATFRGTSAKNLTEAQFLAWANSLTKTKNDYCFWDTTDSDGNVVFKRYKWNDVQWEYEYTLNNSSFTAAQWAAINSGIVEGDVSDLHTHLTDNTRHITAAERASWNSKASDTALQNEITNRTNADGALGTRIDGVSSDLSTHAGNTTVHITSTERTNWNAKATPSDISNAINALDVSDTAVANQFVTKVSETDGKISVSRAQPQISDVKDLQTTLNSKAADSNVVHKTGDETILGIKSFGGGIGISDTGNRNFKCCRQLSYTIYTTSSTSPLPNIASAVVNGVYNIGSTDSQAIAAGYIAGHRYSKLSSDATSYTDVTTGYCKRARIRLNARNTSATINGTLRILLTSTYSSGNNFGAISWNWNGAVPNNATRTTSYMSCTWCDWAAYDASNDWRIFGPCWDSQTEGWYIEIINKGALNDNTNGAVLYIESFGNYSNNVHPLYYATFNDVNILNNTAARLEIVPTPTTISQLRNGAWEDVNVSTYRHIPEVPDSKNRSKVRELFHTGSTIPIANGGTGATTPEGADYNITAAVRKALGAIDGNFRIVCAQTAPSTSLGNLAGHRTFNQVWDWIKSKISSVLGLTATNYGGKAATAGTADKATDSDKLGGQLPSYYATKSEIPDVSGKENTSNKVTTLDNSTTHYPSTSAVTTALSEKQDTISDIATIRSNATNGQTAYGWGDHANAGYLTDADLSGYAKADGSNASGDWAISATKGKLVTRTNFDALTTSGTYEILLEGDELTYSTNPPTEGTTAGTCRGFIEVRNVGGDYNNVVQNATFNVGFIATRRRQAGSWTSWERMTYIPNGSAVGSPTQPVYVDVQGAVQACGFSGLNYTNDGNNSPTADNLKSNNIITHFASLSTNRNINIYFDRMLENVNYRVMAHNTATNNNYEIKLELWSTSGSGVNVNYYTRLAKGTINNGAHTTLATNPAGINLIRVGTSVYAFGY